MNFVGKIDSCVLKLLPYHVILRILEFKEFSFNPHIQHRRRRLFFSNDKVNIKYVIRYFFGRFKLDKFRKVFLVFRSFYCGDVKLAPFLPRGMKFVGFNYIFQPSGISSLERYLRNCSGEIRTLELNAHGHSNVRLLFLHVQKWWLNLQSLKLTCSDNMLLETLLKHDLSKNLLHLNLSYTKNFREYLGNDEEKNFELKDTTFTNQVFPRLKSFSLTGDSFIIKTFELFSPELSAHLENISLEKVLFDTTSFSLEKCSSLKILKLKWLIVPDLLFETLPQSLKILWIEEINDRDSSGLRFQRRMNRELGTDLHSLPIKLQKLVVISSQFNNEHLSNLPSSLESLELNEVSTLTGDFLSNLPTLNLRKLRLNCNQVKYGDGLWFSDEELTGKGFSLLSEVPHLQLQKLDLTKLPIDIKILDEFLLKSSLNKTLEKLYFGVFENLYLRKVPDGEDRSSTMIQMNRKYNNTRKHLIQRSKVYQMEGMSQMKKLWKVKIYGKCAVTQTKHLPKTVRWLCLNFEWMRKEDHHPLKNLASTNLSIENTCTRFEFESVKNLESLEYFCAKNICCGCSEINREKGKWLVGVSCRKLIELHLTVFRQFAKDKKWVNICEFQEELREKNVVVQVVVTGS